MIPTFLGYGVTPYAVIIWRDGDEAKYRTICNDDEDIERMLDRHKEPSDFYHKYEPRVYYTAQKEELIA
ncbi:hypothetical protein [Lysinibacillus sp. NPDC092081]|uniref:hypothetical protein n=1 Tax=Lysinibacillus sp. NPDC092081 TaxID=3364131 RepID=UPI00382633DA